MTWKNIFKYDPIEALLSSGFKNIEYFTKAELLNTDAGDIEEIWQLPEAIQIIKKQKEGGFWKYPGKSEKKRFPEDYLQIETYRNLSFLVEKFGFDKKSETIRDAAEFLFSCQSDEGDFRGIYGNQYSPNYSAAILELLIKAGYKKNPEVKKGMEWLISIRQDDGGWTIPLRTAGNVRYIDVAGKETIAPDRKKPFSHLATGVVLRAFAAHEGFRKRPEAIKAAELLVSRIFQKDKYPDRKKEEYWVRFSYPFWWTDLLSTLDSVSLIGLNYSKPEINEALQWFTNGQKESGLWKVKLLKDRYKDQTCWVAFAVCRVFKRFFGEE